MTKALKTLVCTVIVRVWLCLERVFGGFYLRRMISCARHTKSAGVVWNARASWVIWLILMSRSAERVVTCCSSGLS